MAVNLQIIKNDKYDSFTEKMLMMTYFIHQLFFVFSSSELAHSVVTVEKIADIGIILTFALIILIDFYYFLRGNFSIKEIAIYVAVAIPLLISFMNYRVVMVLVNLVAISCFKNVDVKKALKLYIIATALGILINLLIGVLTPYTFNETTTRYGVERVRYGLGFYWVTFAAHYFYSLVFIYILYKKKLNKFDYTWIMIINVLLFIANDTKAVFFYTILLLIIEFILNRKFNDIFYRIFGVITTISFVIAGLSSFLLSYFYDSSNHFLAFINRILTGRLALMHRGLMEWDITLWGQMVPKESFVFDSSMVSMLVQNGLVVFIICISFMTCFSYLAYKKKSIPLLIALFAIALRSTFDLGFMALQFGPAVMMFNLLTKEKYNNAC